MLLHLVDGTQDDPAEAYRIVRGELDAYGAGLAEKREIVALSKADALARRRSSKRRRRRSPRRAGRAPIVLSAASGAGIEAALRTLWRIIEEGRTADPNEVPASKIGELDAMSAMARAADAAPRRHEA